MADETHPRLVRIADLKRKLAARKRQPGYEKNCEEIQKQITSLEKAHTEELERQAND